MEKKIFKMQYVSIREAFPNEASDFTPWLFENIDFLNDVLEFDIIPDNTEVKQIDGYKVDIIGVDEENNRVIIENQYNKTDHKHLGQLLIYAVTLEAKKIIWLSEEIRQGHIDTVEWLNEQTDKEFYLTEIKIGKVEGGFIPIFNIIVKTTEESKEIGDYKKKIKAYNYDLTPDQQEIIEELTRYMKTLSGKIKKYSGGFNLRNSKKVFCWIGRRKDHFILRLDLGGKEKEGFKIVAGKGYYEGKLWSSRDLYTLDDIEECKEAIKEAFYLTN